MRKDLSKIGGVYGVLNTISSTQYIGSSLNLYSRLLDHIRGRDSNIRLQRSIKNAGLDKFNIVVYYFHTDLSVLLTDIETSVISSFPFDSLYNCPFFYFQEKKKEATSMLGYKQTKEAIEKMKLRFVDKENHPMFGKNHDQ